MNETNSTERFMKPCITPNLITKRISSGPRDTTRSKKSLRLQQMVKILSSREWKLITKKKNVHEGVISENSDLPCWRQRPTQTSRVI